MATAAEAREWGRDVLMRPGIGDSLYTPFTGPDGDGIDYDAYRTLVRHCVGALRHELLWLTSGIAEFWSLTMDERKQLVEVAVGEARAVNPGVILQACTGLATAKDCVGAHPPRPGGGGRHRLHPDAPRWRSTAGRASWPSCATWPTAPTSPSACSTPRPRAMC